jgi:hypothetical protein
MKCLGEKHNIINSAGFSAELKCLWMEAIGSGAGEMKIQLPALLRRQLSFLSHSNIKNSPRLTINELLYTTNLSEHDTERFLKFKCYLTKKGSILWNLSPQCKFILNKYFNFNKPPGNARIQAINLIHTVEIFLRSY